MVYFSERELGPRPRTNEEISLQAWKGIRSAIVTRIEDGSFGDAFPDICTDSERREIIGTNAHLMSQALAGEFPNVDWPLPDEPAPGVYDILDLVEFCYGRVESPIRRQYHAYFGHYHLSYHLEQGRAEFRDHINRIFARNGLAFELNEGGEVVRLAPLVLREALESAAFETEDAALNELLGSARRKFLSHDFNTRKEALEKLWDAWERLKTIEPGKDKKESVTHLLDRTACEPGFRQGLDDEAGALTDIGNKFMIRHTEVDKTPITYREQVDYFFQRLFALIRLVLQSTGRGG
ncbi:MAG: hypothetical protein ABR953_08025 [Candidatus Acidiferrales bacterium]|jgi:hypothetical protein